MLFSEVYWNIMVFALPGIKILIKWRDAAQNYVWVYKLDTVCCKISKGQKTQINIDH